MTTTDTFLSASGSSPPAARATAPTTQQIDRLSRDDTGIEAARMKYLPRSGSAERSRRYRRAHPEKVAEWNRRYRERLAQEAEQMFAEIHATYV
ncbi:hypothetical protein [Rhodococcoides yunnanense]|uniref:hypothetical protein n=1 Tax=Rhodococcoides yunnanense TaxID=278209 RepID=UPI00093517FE|nr:hypothetical protein [Rhodococcus yunnanensis]